MDTAAKVSLILQEIYADEFHEAYIDLQELEEHVPAIAEEVSEFRQVKQEAEDIKLALDMVSDLDSWDLVDDANGIQTYSKGSGNEFLARGEITISTSIFPILALFSEVDLVPTW